VALNQSDFTSCVSVVDPPCVRRLYNIGNYTPAIVDGSNRIGVWVLLRPGTFLNRLTLQFAGLAISTYGRGRMFLAVLLVLH
jgi:hypothetical protein